MALTAYAAERYFRLRVSDAGAGSASKLGFAGACALASWWLVTSDVIFACGGWSEEVHK